VCLSTACHFGSNLKGTAIVAQHESPSAARRTLSYPRAIKLVERGMVDVRSIVTHTYSLDQYQEAFEVASRREGIKVVVEP
jgi:threonine dehydrogenase-like Zn-dependent dehydrogenase